MKNILISASLIVNSGCGVLMTVEEHQVISKEKDLRWQKLKNHSIELENKVIDYKNHSISLENKANIYKRDKTLNLKLQEIKQKRNNDVLEKLRADRERNKLEKSQFQNKLSLRLKEIVSLKEQISALKNNILRKENEYRSLEKSKRRFKCQSWDCFKAAVDGSDSFWDMYASQAESFLGKSPHRRLLEKERKSVLRHWKKGYKIWNGIRETRFDWKSGDRKKAFVIVLGSNYGNSWDSSNDFKMSGKIYLEVKTKKDQAFFDDIHKGAWKTNVYVKISVKRTKSCFFKCRTIYKILKTIKKVEFVPDVENFEWNSKPKKKTFKKNRFEHTEY